jgi:hypothetical protein
MSSILKDSSRELQLALMISKNENINATFAFIRLDLASSPHRGLARPDGLLPVTNTSHHI